MPTYKLTYFAGRGRAEAARMMLAFAKQPYENIVIEGKDWPEFKKNTPFDQLPMLEVDGKTLAQSMAIYRFLANQFGLIPSDSWEAAKCDMIVCAMNDVFDKHVAVMIKDYPEGPEQKWIEVWHEMLNNQTNEWYDKVERLLKENGSGFFVGKKATWCDFVQYAFLETVKQDAQKYPKIAEFKKKFESLPNIVEWIKGVRAPKFNVYIFHVESTGLMPNNRKNIIKLVLIKNSLRK